MDKDYKNMRNEESEMGENRKDSEGEGHTSYSFTTWFSFGCKKTPGLVWVELWGAHDTCVFMVTVRTIFEEHIQYSMYVCMLVLVSWKNSVWPRDYKCIKLI